MTRATIPGMKLMVINLARATQRLASVQELFAGAGLDFTRVEAVDAARLSRADLVAACPPVRFYLANADWDILGVNSALFGFGEKPLGER